MITRKISLGLSVVILGLLAGLYFNATRMAPEGNEEATVTDSTQAAPSVYFITPQDGAVVSSPVQFEFGISGMTVAPAGSVHADSGHHHLLINVDELPDFRLPLPRTDQIIHFGGGETSTTLDLPKGTYTFQLLLGDGAHIPHTPPVMSDKITVEVR